MNAEGDPIIAKYTNAASRFLDVDGCLIHYRDVGAGKPLILLHGSFSSLHVFEPWVTILEKNFRVISMDLPGHGLSGESPDNDYSMDMFVRYLHRLLVHLNIRSATLAGNSLGGWLAWEFTVANPERVDHLVLINAAGFIESGSVPFPFRIARIPLLNKVVKYTAHKRIIETYLKQVHHTRECITDAMIGRYYDMANRESNVRAFYHFVNQESIADHTPLLSRIRVPVLIMWGEEDRWIPVKYGHKFHKAIPGSQLVIFEKTGHVPMEEIPKTSARELIAFMATHDKTRQIA